MINLDINLTLLATRLLKSNKFFDKKNDISIKGKNSFLRTIKEKDAKFSSNAIKVVEYNAGTS